ncbi:phage tail tip lysozyme [Micropruina sp.]|uniref:phage tail tip lysozyme n=1 Tax=Micropruina sp. TaxID=2737536 RepID=UPI0039E63750
MSLPDDIAGKVATLLAMGATLGEPQGIVRFYNEGAYLVYDWGIITAHPVAGVRFLNGHILDWYLHNYGGPSGKLGYPTTDQFIDPQTPAKQFARFQWERACLSHHPQMGAHLTCGAIGDYYFNAMGGPNGQLGYATADEFPDGAVGRTSTFERGCLYWEMGAGVLEFSNSQIPSAGNWPGVPKAERLRHVVEQLHHRHALSVSGACAAAGNFWHESALIPNRIEGSAPDTPMRARNKSGAMADFTAEQIRTRSNPDAPSLGGVGLVQWTYPTRRSALYDHSYQGIEHAENIIYCLDAQLDFAVAELQSQHALWNELVSPRISLQALTDKVAWEYERPKPIADAIGGLVPRDHPSVLAELSRRRIAADEAKIASQL